MFLEAFTDELVKLGRPSEETASPLAKTARLHAGGSSKLYERLLAAGALTGAAGHAASKARVGILGGREPEGTTGGAAGKGAVGGLLAALGLRALGKMGRRRL